MEIYERKPFLCRVYICNKRVEVESVLHLLFYILEKEKAKEDVLGGRVPIYDCIDFADISSPS